MYLFAATGSGFSSNFEATGEMWMLTLYAKNEADIIPSLVLRKIKEEFDGAD